MEKSFEIFLGTGEDQKAILAAYLLKGEANYWWETKKNLEGGGVLTWDGFTKVFLEKYSPKYLDNQMELKFLELRQGNMTVADYERKFTELSRFVLEFVNTKEKSATRFQLGLKQWIQNRVAVLELTDYATLVQKASIVEAGSEQSQKERQGKKRKMGFQRESASVGEKFQGKFVRRNEAQSVRSVGPQKDESNIVSQWGRQTATSYPIYARPLLPECKICGKKHMGLCARVGITCFKCGKIGHYATSCPQANTVCFKCGKIGHVRKECRAPRAAISGQSGTASN